MPRKVLLTFSASIFASLMSSLGLAQSSPQVSRDQVEFLQQMMEGVTTSDPFLYGEELNNLIERHRLRIPTAWLAGRLALKIVNGPSGRIGAKLSDGINVFYLPCKVGENQFVVGIASIARDPSGSD